MLLIKHRITPKRQAKPQLGPLVQTIPLHWGSHQVNILANGTVQPNQAIDLIPQVSGVVTWLDPRFVEGGFFAKGETFFTIDPTDYQLLLQQAKADLAKAKLDYALIEGQAEIAKREWQLQNQTSQAKAQPLVLYTPQLANAKARMAAAEAAVRQAEVNLARTHLTAPFACFIQSENVDLGQYLRSGTVLARIVGTKQADIIAPLPLADLAWLKLPGAAGTGSSVAQVTMEMGNSKVEWQGHVVRLLPEMDHASRMAKLLVTVDDPYLLTKPDREKLPLGMGCFVQLVIQGKTITNALAIPRQARRDNDTIWVVSKDNTLLIKPITILRKGRQQLYIRAEVAEGDKLIISSIMGAANGLKIRLGQGPIGQNHGEKTP